MFDLTKQEKIILIFLALTFVSGLGVSSYKKSQQEVQLRIEPYKSDDFIVPRSKVNINTFKIEELIRLPGVGEKTAAAIVEYRREHGPFMNKEELMRVEGIGEKKFDKMKDLITLE